MITNKVYYQSKSPIACVAFADWIRLRYTTAINQAGWFEKVHLEPQPKAHTTFELYQIWENLEHKDE